MVTTFMDKQQKQLLKKFHALLGKAGIGQEGKEAILSSYGVESSRDLTARELLDVCDKLAMRADPQLAELDRYRKRLIAAIFGYYKAYGREASMNEVKAVACRAAKCDAFNSIAKERLISLYYAFKNKQKDIEAVNDIAFEDMIDNVCLN